MFCIFLQNNLIGIWQSLKNPGFAKEGQSGPGNSRLAPPPSLVLDPREAVKMFLEFRERMPPEVVVSALEGEEGGGAGNMRSLYLYLDALWEKDREASREFQGEFYLLLKGEVSSKWPMSRATRKLDTNSAAEWDRLDSCVMSNISDLFVAHYWDSTCVGL